MQKISRKSIIERYLIDSTIHGLFYLNNEQAIKHKIIWSFILAFSLIGIITSTTLFTIKYLKYDQYILKNEIELDRLETLPNILLCEHDKPSMVNTIALLNKSEFHNNVKKIRQSLLIQSINNISLIEFIESLNMKINKTDSISVFDLSFIKTIEKEYTIAYPFLRFNNCEIIIKNNIYDCLKYIEILFNLNGICFKINLKALINNINHLTLLQKKYYSFSNHEDYKIEFSLKSFTKEKNFIYASLIEEDNERRLKNKFFLAFTERNFKSYFAVHSIRKYYSSSLYNQKCITSEIDCHFDCLKLIIADLLKCYFTFTQNDQSFSLPYCSLNDLIVIEELIIRNYIEIKNLDLFSKRCKTCLPDCDKIEYAVNEIFVEWMPPQLNNLLIYFNFKTTELKHVPAFHFANYLNYINGLWSLFLGISLLSLWEFFEFLFGLLFNYRLIVRKTFNIKCFNTVYKMLNRLLYDSNIHGFKYLFIKANTRSHDKFISFIKLRWLIVMLVVSISFSIMVSDAISNYTNYETNFVNNIYSFYVTDTRNQPPSVYVSDRQITLLICSYDGLKVKKIYDEAYKKLTLKAKDLMKSSNHTYNLNDIQMEYKHFANLLIEQNSFKIDKITELCSFNYSRCVSLDLYKQVFVDEDFDIIIDDLLGKSFKLEFYFSQRCIFYETNLNFSYFKDFKSIIRDWESNSNLVISLVDSKSLYFTPKSSFKFLLSSYFELIGSLKRISYLNAPYKPLCIDQTDYVQDECIKKCINEIIYKKFGCKLIHEKYERREGNIYCHPFMLPLIQLYEIYQLDTRKCNEDCRKPCEIYYYEVEQIFIDYLPTNRFSFKIDNSIEIIEQVQINSLLNTIYIIISFFGLFFGASSLAIFQIFVNFLLLPRKIHSCFNELNSFFCITWLGKCIEKLNFILNTISHSTTIHCARYISSSSNVKYMKRILWLVIITIALLFTIFLSFNELKAYLNEKKTTNLKQIPTDYNYKVRLPDLDICKSGSIKYRQIYYAFDELKLVKNLNDFILNNRHDFLCVSEHNKSCSLKSYIQQYYSEYDEIIKNEKIKNQSSIIDVKLSDILKKQFNEFFGSISISNEINFKQEGIIKLIDNHSIYLHYTGFIYKSEYEIDICIRFDWKLINQNTSDFGYMQINPFIKLSKSQYKINSKDFDVYFEKSIIFKMNQYSNAFYLKPHKYIRKNIELNKLNSAITKTKSLMHYNEYQLFLCNNDFKSAFYQVFNCTPFNAEYDGLIECPAIYMLLINDIIRKVRNHVFNCEIINNLVYVDTSKIAANSILESGIIIDLNDLDVYEEDIINDYDVIKLIVNISNFWNIFIGCSFVTLFEIMFLFYIYVFNLKTSPV